MTRLGSRLGGIVCLVIVACGAWGPPLHAISLDEEGELKLGVRTYAATRIGSEHTDIAISNDYRNYTFPVSPAGHVRQLRGFVEAEFDHNILRLVEQGVGPLTLLDDLPFEFEKLRYHLVYRGEYEGVYDFGPSEYRTSNQFYNDTLVQLPALGPNRLQWRNQVSTAARRRLRDIGVIRNRLFQAFIDAQVSNLFIRFGRQVLSWGETDAFRLLDNINPLDNSFGGFLVSLDERRVPLDMLLANYYFGTIGPFNEIFLEGYAAIDRSVGYKPGTPQGSPWTLPNLGNPSTNTHNISYGPSMQVDETRGGGILKFIAPVPLVGDANFSIAHYYTYLDIPFVQSVVAFNPQTGLGFPTTPVYLQNVGAITIQSTQRTQITGATTSFTIPAAAARKIGLGGEPVIRSELAYFRGEPRFSQLQLDPFLYQQAGFDPSPARPFTHLDICRSASGGPLCVTGGKRKGDSWNFVLGMDMNQFIRFLNPRQSFFFTTQFFYKHLRGAIEPTPLYNPADSTQRLGTNREVLPVPQYNKTFVLAQPLGAVEPKLITQPTNQFLQTLLVTTSYYSGQVNPAVVLFYDWSGGFVFAPTVTLSRDPWRFTLQYNYLEASQLKGASGVSLLRDRDNVLFQLEYVI